MRLLNAMASPLPTPMPVPQDPTWYLVLDVAGTWLGAIGTIAAVVVALRLGVRAVRDQSDQRIERDRGQAERVLLVRTHAIATLRNDSDQPITSVKAVALGMALGERGRAAVLNPHSTVEFAAPAQPLPGVPGPALWVVEFDDAAGRTWVRTTDGRLIRTRKTDGKSTLFVLLGHAPDTESLVTAIELQWQLPNERYLLYKVADPFKTLWGDGKISGKYRVYSAARRAFWHMGLRDRRARLATEWRRRSRFDPDA